jgi:hypothetical protein
MPLHGILPLCGGFGSEDPQCGSGDEVALKVEGIVNRTVHAEEALGGSSRLGYQGELGVPIRSP